MNRNLSKAIAATVAALAGAQTALAQYDPICWPTAANGAYGAGYSNDYNTYNLSDVLFGCTLGLSGTDTYSNNNYFGAACGNEVLTAEGRFGFQIGSLGSVQSTIDDAIALTWGMPFGVGDSCGFAMIVTGTTSPYTRTPFTTLDSAFYGGSDRYFVVGADISGMRETLRVDVLADTAKFTWKLQNTGTTTISGGLMSGMWVVPAKNSPADLGCTYVYAPGYKPLITEHAFHNADSTALFPSTMTFAISQQDAYGLQIVNSPETSPNADGINVPDQTQVDDLVVGDCRDVLDEFTPTTFNTTPSPPYPYLINTDLPFIELPPGFTGNLGTTGLVINPDLVSYLQFWFPKPIAPGATRTIISYYRSTWGVSDYAAPYGAVVDAPKTITTNPGSPNTYANGTFTLRVYIDNVGGYATLSQEVPITNIGITVNLPQGFVNANSTGGATGTLTGHIDSVDPQTTGYKDFLVTATSAANPGPQTYSVQITTGTNASKLLYGTINVAATPTLNLRQGANLVGVPWQFSTPDWSTVLGLTANTQFQAFTWDPSLNQYVVQPNAQRGVGAFIVTPSTLGTVTLGGTPTQSTSTTPDPADPNSQTSSVNITLKQGWNLVANPFNYTISLGQLLGIDLGNPASPQPFDQLVQGNLISSSFAYYNPDSQGYDYISADTDLMVPNQGYWVYVNDTSGIDLIFPKVFAPFTRSSVAPNWKQSEKQWRLQLIARNTKNVDSQNFLGVAPSAVSTKLSSRKPPMPPTTSAVSLAVNEVVSGRSVPMSAVYRSTGGNTQSWNVTVTSKAAGPVTVNWPNMATLPSDVQLHLLDTVTGATRDLRRGAGYTFDATAGGARSFTITSTPGTASRAVIASLQVQQTRGVGAGVTVSYVLGSEATVSVRVLQNGRAIYQAVTARSDQPGTSTATWPLRDSANRQVAPGVYQIEVTAEGADGNRVHRTIPVTVVR
jgi:hypothetical protein